MIKSDRSLLPSSPVCDDILMVPGEYQQVECPVARRSAVDPEYTETPAFVIDAVRFSNRLEGIIG
jgi:hypothetical protein